MLNCKPSSGAPYARLRFVDDHQRAGLAASFSPYVLVVAADSRLVFPSNYNGTVQGLAGVEEGAALAPRLTLEERREDTKVLGEIEDLRPRIIALAWHKDRYRSPAAKAFVETAVHVGRHYAKRAAVRRKAV
jgi:DNA-binding transcriptional LysR family regulator